MTRGAYVLAVDQGTTGSRAILYDAGASVVLSSYREFPQIFPQPGWVEHDAVKIWYSARRVIKNVLQKKKISNSDSISAIGITNQRETTVLWDKNTGKPFYHAIVWQDRRTSRYCERLKKDGYERRIREKTGLVLDPYFSATKIQWMLANVPGIRKKIQQGKVLFGTVDTWILWNLTGGKVHATDPTNASRTLLYNIHTRRWDAELLKVFSIPQSILPEVRSSGGDFGMTSGQYGIPNGIRICSVMGDQQSALYGQSCYRPGEVKNTYGTGCFAVMNLGKKTRKKFPHGLLGTLACDEAGGAVYALEGSIFMGGAVLQWVRDGLKLIRKASDSEVVARRLKDSGGVTMIPAFTGLGSPYWNPHARGMISGMTRGTTQQHIIRAALESIAHQSADVIEQMEKTGVKVKQLKVDGGATRNGFLMQFQADLLHKPVWVSSQPESTAWGTAKLAGKISKFWKASLKAADKITYSKYSPRMKSEDAASLRHTWKKEVKRALL